ncbi:MAG: hypothetical protein DMF96_04590 [Acidobacteria bacterium]|nr:MAG: hypothetical protein DMF96_04590 [Acidobacteriota bacterium]
MAVRGDVAGAGVHEIFGVRHDETLAVVVLDVSAVIPHQRFDLHFVEAAPRQHHSRARSVRAITIRIEARDDPVDVGFEIDPGLVLKFLLPVFLHRQGAVKLLAQLRGHDLVHVRERDGRGVPRDVSKLFGTSLAAERAGGEPDVVGDQPGAQAHAQDQHRDNHEIPGPCSHGHSLKVLYARSFPTVPAVSQL